MDLVKIVSFIINLTINVFYLIFHEFDNSFLGRNYVFQIVRILTVSNVLILSYEIILKILKQIVIYEQKQISGIAAILLKDTA